MEKLSSKEFFEQLKAGSLKPAFTLKGIVKKSEKDSEVLFAKKGNFGKWVSIPASMVESAVVLKSFIKEGNACTLVKLQLKKPTTPEAQALCDLISSMDLEEGKESIENKGGFLGGLMGHSGKACGCHAHSCSCGCHAHSCSCGCHHEGCGCHQGGCGCQQSGSECKSEPQSCSCQK